MTKTMFDLSTTEREYLTLLASAYESGEYEQGTEYLRTADGKMCPIGVAVDVAMRHDPRTPYWWAVPDGEESEVYGVRRLTEIRRFDVMMVDEITFKGQPVLRLGQPVGDAENTEMYADEWFGRWIVSESTMDRLSIEMDRTMYNRKNTQDHIDEPHRELWINLSALGDGGVTFATLARVVRDHVRYAHDLPGVQELESVLNDVAEDRVTV